MRALSNLRRIMSGYKPAQFALTVCDLTEHPEAGNRDQIAFTPTLCKRMPEPPMWILGDLALADPLVELLEFYGVERTHGDRKAHHRHPRV
jgi:KaiB-like protein